VLLRRRLTTFLISYNLLFPWMDFAFTFGFIPGVVLAAFGYYWLVGPVTLMLLPSTAVVATVMYRTSTRVFAQRGVRIRRDLVALIAYTLGYSFILQPVSFGGYMAELLGVRKTWGTK
jgi:biofilm PGA synthesis N-glycosyltransferase PgaC